MYFFNISLVLDGKIILGIPNLTPFSLTILIPSACLCLILFLPIGYKPEDFVYENISSKVRKPIVLKTLILLIKVQ